MGSLAKAVACLTLVSGGVVALPPSAQAVDQTGNGHSTVGVPSGMRQEGSWNLSLRRTRGQIKNVSAFSTDRCMDIKFDWNIPDDNDGDNNHYDARVLRNCRPDSLFTSDGERDSWDNHDEYWVEPAGWGDGPNSNGVREVVAYVIDDDGDPGEDHKYPG